jgi:hypothetical protein
MQRVATYLMDDTDEPRFMPFGGGAGVAIVDGVEYEFAENPAIGMFVKGADRT